MSGRVGQWAVFAFARVRPLEAYVCTYVYGAIEQLPSVGCLALSGSSTNRNSHETNDGADTTASNDSYLGGEGVACWGQGSGERVASFCGTRQSNPFPGKGLAGIFSFFAALQPHRYVHTK